MTLEQYLTRLGLRPGSFAKAAGVETASLYRFMAGQGGLSDDTKLKIEKATNGLVSAGDLVRRDTGGNPPSVGASSGAAAPHRASPAASDGTS